MHETILLLLFYKQIVNLKTQWSQVKWSNNEVMERSWMTFLVSTHGPISLNEIWIFLHQKIQQDLTLTPPHWSCIDYSASLMTTAGRDLTCGWTNSYIALRCRVLQSLDFRAGPSLETFLLVMRQPRIKITVKILCPANVLLYGLIENIYAPLNEWCCNCQTATFH